MKIAVAPAHHRALEPAIAPSPLYRYAYPGRPKTEHAMQRADEFTPASDRQKVALGYFTRLMNKDFQGFRAILSDDFVQENPYMPELPGTPSRFENPDRLVFHVSTVLEKRRNHAFYIISMHDSADGETVIVEAAGRSEVPETGQIYDQRYVLFCTIRDGKMSYLREYFNPVAFQNAFDGFLVGEGAVPN